MIIHGVNLVLGNCKINAIICYGVNLVLGKIQRLNVVTKIFVNLMVLKINYV